MTFLLPLPPTEIVRVVLLGMFISVCLSVWARNSKTIAPIDFISLDNLLYFTYPLLSSLGYQILLKVQYER